MKASQLLTRVINNEKYSDWEVLQLLKGVYDVDGSWHNLERLITDVIQACRAANRPISLEIRAILDADRFEDIPTWVHNTLQW